MLFISDLSFNRETRKKEILNVHVVHVRRSEKLDSFV